MIKRICFFIISSLMLAYSAFSDKPQAFTIYYTSSLNGNLDGCECHDAPKAGLVKRAAYLRTIDKKNALLVDTGDIFSTFTDELLHQIIVDSYNELGYDIVCLGDQDFAEGYDFIKTKANGLFRSDNTKYNNNAISSGPFTVTSGSSLIDIYTITDKGVYLFYPETLTSKLSITDPVKFLSQNIDPDKINIVIFHGKIGAVESILKTVKNIDVLLFGHEQMLYGPKRIKNTWILSPGEQGNRVGKLVLTIKNGKLTGINNSFTYFSYKDDADDSIIRKYIINYYNALRPKVKK